jgi:hypothetical protein
LTLIDRKREKERRERERRERERKKRERRNREKRERERENCIFCPVRVGENVSLIMNQAKNGKIG